MTTTTSTRPARPEETVEEVQEALDEARAQNEDLVELHEHHMEAYDDAHQGVHSINNQILSLKEDRYLMDPIGVDWARSGFMVIKEGYALDMGNSREAVKEVRAQLREVAEIVRAL